MLIRIGLWVVWYRMGPGVTKNSLLRQEQEQKPDFQNSKRTKTSQYPKQEPNSTEPEQEQDHKSEQAAKQTTTERTSKNGTKPHGQEREQNKEQKEQEILYHTITTPTNENVYQRCNPQRNCKLINIAKC